ncbi:MAG: ferritin-like domain-containing protein [Planctomycetales bacterium]|nr:ferritin-like domain-containing protein [Planctomycetales bacterium]
MLLTREELRYDVGSARFDLARDRDLLAWIFSQALYGEATGCYCGATLYTAPDIDAATFLSRQAVEEFAHFRNFLKIFKILGAKPSPPNRVIKFLSSHERLWDHHVALEMALGEGLVLVAFYALEDAVPHPEVQAILASIGRQEEGHVTFGEERTLEVLRETPRRRRQLLGRCLLSVVALRFLARHVEKRLPAGHPVLSQLPRFLEHVLRTTEIRMQRLGLLTGSLSEIGFLRRWALIANGLFWAKARGLFARRRPRIPGSYLSDPVVERVLAGRPEPVVA